MFFELFTNEIFEKTFVIFISDQSLGQIIGGDFPKFCGLLRKHELYVAKVVTFPELQIKRKHEKTFQQLTKLQKP